MNIFETMESRVSDEVVNIIAKNLGESPENIRTAIDSMMKTLVGGLMKRTTSTMGLNQLYAHVQKGNYNSKWLTNLAQLLQDTAKTKELIANGGSLTSQLFPAMKSQISGMVLDIAGIRSSSASSLISIVTPMVVSVLNDVYEEQHLTADGLADLLGDQKDTLLENTNPILLEKMVNVLALQEILSGKVVPAKLTPIAPIQSKSSTTIEKQVLQAPVFEHKKTPLFETKKSPSFDYEPDDDSNDKSSTWKWIAAALGGISLLVAGYYGYQYYQTPTVKTSSVDSSAIKIDSSLLSVDSSLNKIDTSKAKIDSIAIPTTAPIDTPAAIASAKVYPAKTPFGKKLVAAPIKSYVSLTGIDYELGTINMTTGSDETIKELVKIMVAMPGLQVKIISTANDAQGSQSNQTLSNSRAFDIKRKLMVAGIDPIRIDASGAASSTGKSIGLKIIKK